MSIPKESNEQFIRTEMVIGKEAQDILKNKKVYLFGVGGVGSYCAEALVRAGIGSVVFIDNDTVSVTNINRQLIALHSTVGMYKARLCADRARDINPCGTFEARCTFYDENTAKEFDFSDGDFIIDAIDSVPSKILLIKKAKEAGVPIICSMGTGNKLDPSKFMISDIEKTSVCPLARTMRQRLKKEGIKDVPVLYSTELPRELSADARALGDENGKRTVGSISFVPSAAGLMIAGYVIRRLCGIEQTI